MAWFDFWRKTPAHPQAVEQKQYSTAELLSIGLRGRAQFQNWNTEAAINEGLKSSAVFYSCVRIRYEAVGSVPWKVYKKNRDGSRTEVPLHPLQQLINNPNPDFSWSDMMQLASMHLDLAGNAYWSEIRGGNGGFPIELWPLLPQYMKIQPGYTRLVESYIYTPRAGGAKTIPADDIIQIKTPNPDDFLFGMPTIQAAGRAVDIDRDAGQWQKDSLHNRGVSDYAVVLDTDTTPEQYGRIKELYKEQQAGPSNARKPWFTTKDIKPLNQSAVEMDFVNSRVSTWQEICSAEGVPMPMIGILTDATLANIAVSRRIFWLDTIIPLLRMIRGQLQSQLASEFGPDIEIDYDISGVEALREDMTAKMNNARNLWGMGVDLARINDMLELDIPDIDNLEGADVAYVPAGLLPAGEDFSALTGTSPTTAAEDEAAGRAAFGAPASVQQQALNGAQMTSLQGIAQAVADGQMPSETAIALIMISIPGMSEQTARTIIDPAETFTPAAPANGA